MIVNPQVREHADLSHVTVTPGSAPKPILVLITYAKAVVSCCDFPSNFFP